MCVTSIFDIKDAYCNKHYLDAKSALRDGDSRIATGLGQNAIQPILSLESRRFYFHLRLGNAPLNDISGEWLCEAHALSRKCQIMRPRDMCMPPLSIEMMRILIIDRRSHDSEMTFIMPHHWQQ